MTKSTISVGCDAMTGRNPARSHATPASELLALRARESTYPGAAEHISTVRADLRPLLRNCPVADDVILCASELAANAATHSNSRLPGGTFTVRGSGYGQPRFWEAGEPGSSDPGRLTSPSPICLAEHLVEFGVGPDRANFLRAAAGDGDPGSPLQRLLA
jgi:anti-sigma regulatory factor (Ser/Thr protein kinase)